MADDAEELSGKHLTAKELLTARGISARALDEYTQVSKVLPKTGVKLFEPNGSLLQKKQIDTCLETRRDLINIERVNRLSTLAKAQWLPDERKAVVVKRSGVDWNNYGNVIAGVMYIIPEVALLLLELNQLELWYNGVSLSIQQAYAILIESPTSDCTLNEYRVFSQLARLGYRLQRYQYKSSSTERSEQVVPKKKVIIDPENGRWMSNSEACGSNNSNSAELDDGVKQIVESLVDKVESNIETDKIAIEHSAVNDNKKRPESKAKGKLEIVSEETVIEPVKLVVNQPKNSDNKLVKRAGSRIQRNVKLLPKRVDKVEKRKSKTATTDNNKTSKHEIIELSDDEIEEIPRKMSRMEMLNCLPNIAAKDVVTQVISRAYIPHSIKPQKSIYEYDRAALQRIQNNNKVVNLSNNLENSNNHESLNTVACNTSGAVSNSREIWRNRACHFQNGHHSSNSARGMNRGRYHYHKHTANHYSGTNHQNFMTNRWSSFQFNIFKNFSMAGHALRTTLMFQQFMYGHHSQQTQTGKRRYEPIENSNSQRSHSDDCRGQLNSKKNNKINNDEVYKSSFAKMAANSWHELKKKWKEAKTITIEDEDVKMDCSEVEVVNQTIQPLVGAKNAGSLAEIYERLQIIKPAQEKNVRKKKGDYKISYKVYSNAKHYKKSDPGLPMFHLVITSRKKSFLQPIDLNRLQQDEDGVALLFAYVCGASVTFMQAGVVSLPNLSES